MIEGSEINFKSQMGINVSNPPTMLHIEYVNHEYKTTWAEKRFDELVYKLKSIKAWRNRILGIIMALILIFFSLCIVGIIDSHVHSDFNHFMTGILGAELIILSCTSYAFVPTDPYDLTIKHKGKKH